MTSNLLAGPIAAILASLYAAPQIRKKHYIRDLRLDIAHSRAGSPDGEIIEKQV
jgi:hypothetical protein